MEKRESDSRRPCGFRPGFWSAPINGGGDFAASTTSTMFLNFRQKRIKISEGKVMKRETMTRRKKIAAGKGKGAAAGAVQSGSVITTDVVASQQGNAGENMERLLLETESSNGHMIPGVDLLALESDVIDLGSTVEVAAETIQVTGAPAMDTNVPVEIVKNDSTEVVSTEVRYLSDE